MAFMKVGLKIKAYFRPWSLKLHNPTSNNTRLYVLHHGIREKIVICNGISWTNVGNASKLVLSFVLVGWSTDRLFSKQTNTHFRIHNIIYIYFYQIWIAFCSFLWKWCWFGQQTCKINLSLTANLINWIMMLILC